MEGGEYGEGGSSIDRRKGGGLLVLSYLGLWDLNGLRGLGGRPLQSCLSISISDISSPATSTHLLIISISIYLYLFCVCHAKKNTLFRQLCFNFAVVLFFRRDSLFHYCMYMTWLEVKLSFENACTSVLVMSF